MDMVIVISHALINRTTKEALNRKNIPFEIYVLNDLPSLLNRSSTSLSSLPSIFVIFNFPHVNYRPRPESARHSWNRSRT